MKKLWSEQSTTGCIISFFFVDKKKDGRTLFDLVQKAVSLNNYIDVIFYCVNI